MKKIYKKTHEKQNKINSRNYNKKKKKIKVISLPFSRKQL
jgi:hypothetical protein